MAAIVRVKRRFDEDAANSLLLSCKRFRSSDNEGQNEPSDIGEVKSIFKFAGTLSTKHTDVTNHVRDAIRREKRQLDYKNHHQVDVVSRSRNSHTTASHKNRFKIVSSRRAIDLDSLDKEDISDIELPSGQSDNVCSQSRTNNCDNERSPQVVKPHNDSAENNLAQSHGQSCDNGDASQSASGLFCLYDIEEEPTELDSGDKPVPKPTETITCNGIAMVREKTKLKPPEDQPQYVYDIYYMNSAGFDFRSLENILAIEALREDLMWEGDRGGEGRDLQEDEDSNDEDNWRNDYPDEEGGMFADQIVDFSEQNGSWDDHDRSPDHYEEDQGISHMMGDRLKLYDSDDLSSEDEDRAYFKQSLDGATLRKTNQSYDSYKQHVLQELRQDYGEDDSS